MKNELFVMFIAVSLLILVSGCSSDTASNKYHIGVSGLNVEFVKGSPTNVYEGDEFGTAIYVKNLGSSDVDGNNPGVLKVSYDDYRLQPMSANTAPKYVQPISVHGLSQAYPQGDEAYYTYNFKARPLTKLRESSKTTINYNICYPYKTEFTTFTCIDTKSSTETSSASACQVQDYDGTGGQGGPITVTKIQSEILFQSGYTIPRFKIYIQNVGQGYVTNANSCVNNNINDQSQLSRVNVYATLSGDPLQCGSSTQSNVITLQDSESYIMCTLTNNQNSKYLRTQKNFLSPLTITIKYTYTSIYSQDLEVDSNNNYNPTNGGDTSAGLQCASYQIAYNGTCISKCDYCSGDPTNSICTDANIMTKGFDFTGFSCSCKLSQCDTKTQEYGNCLKSAGYRAGDTYCCSENIEKCDAQQVLYNGKCVDKCTYCSTINPLDTDICAPSGLEGFDFTGFSCGCSKTQCDQYNAVTPNSCVKGFCGGANINQYCCNQQKLTCAGNQILYDNKCITWCDYCSLYDPEHITDNCKIMNGQYQVDFSSKFSCSCTSVDITNIFRKSYVNDLKFCDNGDYCCNKEDQLPAKVNTTDVRDVIASHLSTPVNPQQMVLQKVNTTCGLGLVPVGNDCVEKCTYCAANPTADVCKTPIVGTWNNVNFNYPNGFTFNKDYKCSCQAAQCLARSPDECMPAPACDNSHITEVGGEPYYCCYDPPPCPANEVRYNGTCRTWCDVCKDMPGLDNCKVKNLLVDVNVTSSFSCGCNALDNVWPVPITYFVPDAGFCSNGQFCCDTSKTMSDSQIFQINNNGKTPVILVILDDTLSKAEVDKIYYSLQKAFEGKKGAFIVGTKGASTSALGAEIPFYTKDVQRLTGTSLGSNPEYIVTTRLNDVLTLANSVYGKDVTVSIILPNDVDWRVGEQENNHQVLSQIIDTNGINHSDINIYVLPGLASTNPVSGMLVPGNYNTIKLW